ncbi:MAG: hypothetical protein DRI86_03700 [Bacteroidetes bacterium]|nr:MAG: hypothetical protein DRI86_03700 [Bacteroidota bacterium]
MRITIIILLSIFIFSNTSFAQNKTQDCQFEVSKKSQKLYKRAMKELNLKHYGKGTSLLKEAIEESSEYLKAYWVLANVNKRKSNPYRKIDISISAYENIIDICPSYEGYYSYYYLGTLYYDKKNWKKAHTNLEKFLNCDNDRIREKHFEDAADLSKYAKFYNEIYNNPVPFAPFIVKDVSSKDDEYLPSLSPDNDFFYFTRRYKDNTDSRSGSYKKSNGEEKFCRAKKLSINRYSIGQTMELPFNEQSNEGGATLTINNKELFYTRCQIKKDRTLNCDIAYSKYEDGYWSDIISLGSNINTPDYWESMPSISSDGKTIFFVSNRAGGFGGSDIYRSTKNKNGKWGKAVNMGPSINTAGNEKSPFIHTDSKTLYFSSSDRKDKKTGEWFAGHLGLGGYDIFFTRLDSNGWIEPKNIGYPINSKDNDLGFFVSTNGEYGFFASNKLGNNDQKKEVWNIYSFKLYKKARPQKILFIKGNLRDNKTNEGARDAKIFIKNMNTKEINEIPIDSNTGDYVFTTVMESDFIMTVKKQDYAYVSRYIAKDNSRFNVPISMDMELKEIEVGGTYNLDDVYFATNSTKLTDNSKKVIEEFYNFLHENPKIIIEIQGHTDNVGTEIYNQKLSRGRAKSVYELLINLGISDNQMSYKGYGETMPISENRTEEGRALNRRTVFLIIKK